jgi:hypothetical protein
MIDAPIKLERIEKSEDDQAIYFELETIAAARGGKLAGKEPTLTELLYNVRPDDMLTLNQVLETD